MSLNQDWRISVLGRGLVVSYIRRATGSPSLEIFCRREFNQASGKKEPEQIHDQDIYGHEFVLVPLYRKRSGGEEDISFKT